MYSGFPKTYAMLKDSVRRLCSWLLTRMSELPHNLKEIASKAESDSNEIGQNKRSVNRKQRAIIKIGIIFIILMALFPPWVSEYGGVVMEQEYRFILNPLDLANVDSLRLLVQWVGVCIVTIGLVWICRD